MFSSLPWHGADRFVDEGETDQEDPEWKPLRQHQEVPNWRGLYLYWQKQREMEARFKPVLVPLYQPQFSRALALTEIGIAARIAQLEATSTGTSVVEDGRSPSLADVPSGVWQGIVAVSAAAWALANLPGGPGGKVKALNMAAKVPWFALQGDFINNVARMMREGIVPIGNDLVQEKIPEQWYNQQYPSRYMHGSSPGG